MSDGKSNVIPMIRDGKTRKIVKEQFDRPPATRPGGLLDPMATKQAALQEKLAKINQTMGELKDMVTKQNEYLSETGSDLAPLNQSSLDEEKLRAEYERKKNAAKKYREENNRKVTREYRLSPKQSGRSRNDDK